MAKITIHAGHNRQGKIACGASDYIDESREARIVCKKLISILRKNRYNVRNCTVNNGVSQLDVLKKICAKCNSKPSDLDVSIHFNACTHSKSDGKVKGTEVLVYSDNQFVSNIGKKICSNMNKLGFTNRGVKISKDLYFLKHTNAPAILVEVCFVDDEDDVIRYLKNRDKIVKAIAKGIMEYI